MAIETDSNNEDIPAEVLQWNLQCWQAFVQQQFPISRNRPDTPTDYWNRILNNTVTQKEIERDVKAAEYSSAQLRTNTYKASSVLIMLRRVGFLPIPK